MLTLTLPFPPSVNRYWRHVGRRTLLSREGRQFRERVCSLVAARKLNPLVGELAVSIDLHPRDRRRRDADNFLKATLDALEHAGVYKDDAQIAHLEIDKCDPIKSGRCVVRIEPHDKYIERRKSLFELVCCAGCGRDTYRQADDRRDAYCERCVGRKTHAFPEDLDRKGFDSDLLDDFDEDDGDDEEDDWY